LPKDAITSEKSSFDKAIIWSNRGDGRVVGRDSDCDRKRVSGGSGGPVWVFDSMTAKKISLNAVLIPFQKKGTEVMVPCCDCACRYADTGEIS